MARVKLKDGRTGDLLHIHEGIATVNVDTTSNNPGGTMQVAASDILETAAGAELSSDVPLIPQIQPEPKKENDPGVMALAGSAALLKPVFVQALIEALQHPAVADSLAQAVARHNEQQFKDLLNPETELGELFSEVTSFAKAVNTLKPVPETAAQKPGTPKKKAAVKKKAAPKK